MLPARPLHVAVRIPRQAPAAWHGHAIDAVRRVNGVVCVEIGEATDVATDIVVDLAGEDPARPLRVLPRIGVWRYGFGDGAPAAGGFPGTIARLYQTTGDRDRGLVLHEGWFGSRTRESPGTPEIAARVSGWAARALEQLVAGELDGLGSPPQTIADANAQAPPAVRWSVADILRTAVYDLRKRDRWTIGLVPTSWRALLDRGELPEPVWLANQPPDRYYADPFPLEASDQGVRLLVEDYRFSTGQGSVAELDVSREGAIRGVVERIAPDTHASYPFVLRSEGRLFCVPETARLGRVFAYEPDGAAGSWRKHGELLSGFAAVDPTLVEHDGRWWLFCTNRVLENRTELHVFSAADWRGPWAPHPLNPVKSDARSSRPAGAMVTIDGVLYRPAQNCARRYGGGITVNRVVELTPRRFREEPILSITPRLGSPWPDGIHTINACGDLMVVDGLRVDRRL